MLQADEEDDAMDQQMKSPFGSSFRTFDATDYKPIGRQHFLFMFIGQKQFCFFFFSKSRWKLLLIESLCLFTN